MLVSEKDVLGFPKLVWNVPTLAMFYTGSRCVFSASSCRADWSTRLPSAQNWRSGEKALPEHKQRPRSSRPPERRAASLGSLRASRVTSAHNQRLCHQVSSFLGPAADAQAEVTQGCPLLGPAPSGLGNCDQWARSTPDCCESPVTNSRSRVLSAWVSGTDQEAVGVSATGTAMSK